jgi:hypothetical protein
MYLYMWSFECAAIKETHIIYNIYNNKSCLFEKKNLKIMDSNQRGEMARKRAEKEQEWLK